MMKKANNYVWLTGIVAVVAVVAIVMVSMGGMSNDSNMAGEARFTSPSDVENSEQLPDDGMIECGSCVDGNGERHMCKQESVQSSDELNPCECPVEDAKEFYGDCKPNDAENCEGICLYEFDGEVVEKPCYKTDDCRCNPSFTDVNNNEFELVGLEGDCMGPDQNKTCGRCLYEEDSLNQPCYEPGCECPVKDGMAPRNMTGDCKAPTQDSSCGTCIYDEGMTKDCVDSKDCVCDEFYDMDQKQLPFKEVAPDSDCRPPREESESCGMCVYEEGVEVPCYENKDCVCNEYYTESAGDGADSVELRLVEITGDCQK